jgi:hypothetical protein
VSTSREATGAKLVLPDEKKLAKEIAKRERLSCRKDDGTLETQILSSLTSLRK